jgi:hypothetical protein
MASVMLCAESTALFNSLLSLLLAAAETKILTHTAADKAKNISNMLISISKRLRLDLFISMVPSPLFKLHDIDNRVEIAAVFIRYRNFEHISDALKSKFA